MGAPSVLVSVDPGKQHAGVAVFIDRVLYTCAYIATKRPAPAASNEVASRARTLIPHGMRVSIVVSEWPSVRDNRRAKGSAAKSGNDLLFLTHTVGAINKEFFEADVHEIVGVNTWKGSLDKDLVMHRVLEKRLSPQEIAVVSKNGYLKNDHVLEAVGVGLWRLYRF